MGTKSFYYNKICLLFFLMAAVTEFGFAQENPASLKLTLQTAREIGASRSANMQSKSLDALIAQEQVKLAGKGFLPNIYADVNLQRNLVIPVTPVPAKAFNPNAQEGELTLLKFATNWTGNTGINLDYQLFNPEQKSQVRQQQIQAGIAETEKKIEEADVILNISKAYIAALIAKEQADLSHADVLAKTGTLEMLSEQYEAGRLKLTDLNTGKASVNTAISNEKDAQNILAKARADLLYQLGYNPFDTIAVSFDDTIELLFDAYNTSDTKEKTGLTAQKLQQQRQLLEEQKVSARVKYLPQVNLGAYYGSSYFDNVFDVFKDRNWHGNSFVKLGLRIPITDWSAYKNDRQILELQIRNNQMALHDEENQSSLHFFKALKDKDFFKEKFREMKKNFSLEQQNYKLVKQQYDEGRLFISDLYQADYLVQVARNEYLNAAYNYLLAEMTVENELSK